MKDISGAKYGKLTVISPSGKGYGGRIKWLCQCECGNKKQYFKNNLDAGRNHCGCDANKTFNVRHGMRNHELYGVWNAMINRCHNVKNASYPEYGGRGIFVCERWHDIAKFIEDMHPRPIGQSLDRIDVNGNYSPNNVRWASSKIQRWNQRVVCKTFSNGMTSKDVAEIQGVKEATIRMRISRGWSDKEILNGKRTSEN